MRGTLACIALVAAGCASQPKVVGTWEAVHRSAGGMGSVWTFFPDGKIEMYAGPIVEAWYVAKGNRLVEPGDATIPGTSTFRIEGDALVKQYEVRGQRLEFHFTRVGTAPANASPPIGVWRQESSATVESIMSARRLDRARAQRLLDMHNLARLEYTRDGVMKYRLPLRLQQGTYDATNGTFAIAPENGGAARTGRMRFQDGLLVLTQPDGRTEDLYIRADATKAELKRAGVRNGEKPAPLDPPADLPD